MAGLKRLVEYGSFKSCRPCPTSILPVPSPTILSRAALPRVTPASFRSSPRPTKAASQRLVTVSALAAPPSAERAEARSAARCAAFSAHHPQHVADPRRRIVLLELPSGPRTHRAGARGHARIAQRTAARTSAHMLDTGIRPQDRRTAATQFSHAVSRHRTRLLLNDRPADFISDASTSGFGTGVWKTARSWQSN